MRAAALTASSPAPKFRVSPSTIAPEIAVTLTAAGRLAPAGPAI